MESSTNSEQEQTVINQEPYRHNIPSEEEASSKTTATRAAPHDFEIVLRGIPTYFNESSLSEEIRAAGLTKFRRVHKASGWSYAFINFEVCIIVFVRLHIISLNNHTE